MRISDWSSDVCSSDLEDERHGGVERAQARADRLAPDREVRKSREGRRRLQRHVRREAADVDDADRLGFAHELRVHRGDGYGDALRRLSHRQFLRAYHDLRQRLLLLWALGGIVAARSEEHTSALPSILRISYAVFYLTNKISLRLTVF